jgi:hypothetical protein
MLKLAENHWGRWVDTLAARLRPAAPAAAADASADEPVPCKYCGHALQVEVAFSPRCALCGDGDSSLALYSQHALHRAATAVRH